MRLACGLFLLTGAAFAANRTTTAIRPGYPRPQSPVFYGTPVRFVGSVTLSDFIGPFRVTGSIDVKVNGEYNLSVPMDNSVFDFTLGEENLFLPLGDTFVEILFVPQNPNAQEPSGTLAYFWVTKAKPDLALTLPQPARAEAPFTVNVARKPSPVVVPPAGLPQSWKIDGAAVQPVSQPPAPAFDGNGTFAFEGLPLGPHRIEFIYGGGDYYDAGTTGLDFEVFPPITPTALSAPVTFGEAAYGQAVAFQTKITPPVSGTAAFWDGGTWLGSAPFTSTGEAALSVSNLAIGAHAISARYQGSVLYGASISPVLNQVIRGKPTVALSVTPNPSVPRAEIELTAHLTKPSINSPAPTGSVTFKDGAQAIGTAEVSQGIARFNVTSLNAGNHSITAVYGGDALYQAANSEPIMHRVAGTATTTSLMTILDDTPSLRVRVTSTTASVPSGAVRISAGSNEAAVSLAEGEAILTDATAMLGRRVTAEYTGDADHEPSSLDVLVPAALNAFSYRAAPLAPEQAITLFGDALALRTETAAGLPLPDTLGGLKVELTGSDSVARAAVFYYASPDQATFVVPGGLPEGTAKLAIANDAGANYLAEVTIARVAPGIAAASANGQGPPAAQLFRASATDGTVIEPVAEFQSANQTWTPVPIVFGGDTLHLVLYGTGFRHASAPVTCDIAGQSIAAAYVGPQSEYPGLDQINLPLPAQLAGAGDVLLGCSADGRSSNQVQLLFP